MNSMTLNLEGREGKHLYEQIYDHIKQEMKTGKLLYGEKLPSTRSLAEYLQISRSTVELAYEQLVAEGYIEARPCRGYFVSHAEELYDIPERALTAEEVWQEERREDFFVDFSTSAVDLDAFPYDTWKRLYRQVFEERGRELFLPGEGQGERALRVVLARYLHSSRGVNCEPEQIVIGAGSEYLLMLLDKILRTAGVNPCIAVENPTYRKASDVMEALGYGICPVGMDAQGICMEELEQSGASLAYVMPAHQYPTGIVMPIRRRMELLQWAARQQGRYLIEDDYDSEFRYRGKPIPALQASDQQGRVIYLGTFSKAITPAIRVSFMVLPDALISIYHQVCRHLSTTVGKTEQAVLTEFIRGGYFERHLNRMRKVYREKHDMMLEGLKNFSECFEVMGENAGVHLLLRDKKGRSEKELIQRAAEHGIRIYGMSKLRFKQTRAGRDEAGGQHSQKTSEADTVLLLGYGGLSLEEIQTGLTILAQIWL